MKSKNFQKKLKNYLTNKKKYGIIHNVKRNELLTKNMITDKVIS